MKGYTLTQPAYGKQPGDTIKLNPDDALVRLNVENGVLVEGADGKVEPQKMTCPICDEHMQRPPKLENAEDLAAHYEEKHAGFVVPAWLPDNEEDRQA